MIEDKIGKVVVDAAIAVRKAFGPGLYENGYEVIATAFTCSH